METKRETGQKGQDSKHKKSILDDFSLKGMSWRDDDHLDKVALLAPIPKSLYLVGLRLIPCIGKSPCLADWPINALTSLDRILWLQEVKKITDWAILCGPDLREAGTADAGVLAVDKDFQKKNQKPVGPALLGKLKQKTLDTGIRLFSQSFFEGQFGEHYLWLYTSDFNFLKKGRLSKKCTLDIQTTGRCLRVYNPLPPGFKLTPPPKTLIQQLRAEANQQKKKTFSFAPGQNQHQKGKLGQDWAEGHRHDTLVAEAYAAYKRGGFKKTLTALFHTALESGLPENEILKVFEWCQEVVDVIPPPEDQHRPPPKDKSQGPKKGRKKQKLELKADWLEGVTAEKPEFFDKERLFPKKKLITLSGDKGSLKSTGTISYLLYLGLNFGYYSDGETTKGQLKDIQDRAHTKGAKGKVCWMPLDQISRGDEFDDFLKTTMKDKPLDLLFEDPAPEECFASVQTTRAALKRRVDICDAIAPSWMVTRNYRKDKTSNIGDNISSFAVWRNMPRSVLITIQAEPGSKPFLKAAEDVKKKTDKKGILEQMSMLHCNVSNLGKRPEHAVLFKLIVTKETGKYMEFEIIPVPKKPEFWGKVTSQAELERKDTETHRILFHISEVSKDNKKGGFDISTEGISSGELRSWLIEVLAFSRAKAVRKIADLKEEELIKGGGKGAKKPLTLTDKGKKMLED